MADQSKQTALDRIVHMVRWFSDQTGWLAGALALVMMLATVREVTGRYFFNAPTDWAIDLNAFLLVGMVYLGAAHTTFIDGHVRADFFYSKIRGRPKAVVDIIIDAVCITYCAMLAWEGWLLAYESLRYNEVSSGGVRWPLFPFQVLVPIGGVFVIVCLLIRILLNLRFLFFKGEPFVASGGSH